MKIEYYMYLWYNYDIESQLLECNDCYRIYKVKILGKYEKYKDMIDTFDKFVILCDATNGIEVISQQDAEDIFDIISEKAPLKNVEISIVTSADVSINCFSS